MTDKRTAPRKRVNEKIDVMDQNTGKLVGNLVNISTGGLMLLSESPITPNQLFQLRVVPPSPIDGASCIDFGVECLWVQDSSEPGPLWAGFQIIDISDEGSALIVQLMNDWTE